MHYIKKISILFAGSLLTYTACNYLMKTNSFSFNNDKNVEISEELTSTLKNDQKIAMLDAKKGAISNPIFFQNTYQDSPVKNGLPKLKHGKRYYNEERMEEISTSANLEETNSENE